MFELLPLLSGSLRVATLLESLHAKHVGIFSPPGRSCLLTCHWIDHAPHSFCGPARTTGRATALPVYYAWTPLNRSKLSLCCDCPVTSKQLRRWITSAFPCTCFWYSSLYLLRNAGNRERGFLKASRTVLGNAGDGAQYRHCVWGRST